jgi:hypothetical protein
MKNAKPIPLDQIHLGDRIRTNEGAKREITSIDKGMHYPIKADGYTYREDGAFTNDPSSHASLNWSTFHCPHKKPDKNFNELEVGCTYRRRDGEIRKIIRDMFVEKELAHSIDRFLSDESSHSYHKSGSYYPPLENIEHPHDLIEKITTTTEEKPMLKLEIYEEKKEPEAILRLKLFPNDNGKYISLMAVNENGKSVIDNHILSINNKGELILHTGINKDLDLQLDDRGRIKVKE